MSGAGSRIAYKPVGLILGVAAGAVAGRLFKQVWREIGHGSDAPHAKDEDRGWGEVLIAATLEGAIFAVVRAAVDRAGATGMRRVTGRWPA